MQIRLNNRYMDVKIHNEFDEFTINFIDSDLLFFLNWFNKHCDPITGMINNKKDYVKDIYFKRNPNYMYLSTDGFFKNCVISELSIEQKLITVKFDFIVDYDPVIEKLK